MEVVDGDLRVRQRRPDPRRIRGGRVDGHDLHLLPDSGALLGKPAPHSRAGATGSRPSSSPSATLPHSNKPRRRSANRAVESCNGVGSQLPAPCS